MGKVVLSNGTTMYDILVEKLLKWSVLEKTQFCHCFLVSHFYTLSINDFILQLSIITEISSLYCFCSFTNNFFFSPSVDMREGLLLFISYLFIILVG